MSAKKGEVSSRRPSSDAREGHRRPSTGTDRTPSVKAEEHRSAADALDVLGRRFMLRT